MGVLSILLGVALVGVLVDFLAENDLLNATERSFVLFDRTLHVSVPVLVAGAFAIGLLAMLLILGGMRRIRRQSQRQLKSRITMLENENARLVTKENLPNVIQVPETERLAPRQRPPQPPAPPPAIEPVAVAVDQPPPVEAPPVLVEVPRAPVEEPQAVPQLPPGQAAEKRAALARTAAAKKIAAPDEHESARTAASYEDPPPSTPPEAFTDLQREIAAKADADPTSGSATRARVARALAAVPDPEPEEDEVVVIPEADEQPSLASAKPPAPPSDTSVPTTWEWP